MTIPASRQALESELSLNLLSAIEDNESVSQRSLALRLGIAVGLTNAYLKRCARKGWVKIQQVPARRYAYYLTPRGFAEKSRLVTEYLTTSFSFFRTARKQCLELLQACERRGWRRVVLVGDGELAEVTVIAAMETGVELVAVVAPGCNATRLAGVRVVGRLDDAGEVDAVLVTDIRAAQEVYERLRGAVADERILTPELLHVTRRAADGDRAGGAA